MHFSTTLSIFFFALFVFNLFSIFFFWIFWFNCSKILLFNFLLLNPRNQSPPWFIQVLSMSKLKFWDLHGIFPMEPSNGFLSRDIWRIFFFLYTCHFLLLSHRRTTYHADAVVITLTKIGSYFLSTLMIGGGGRNDHSTIAINHAW